MKEIKADEVTWADVKRLSEENERLVYEIRHREWIIENLRNEIKQLENKTND